MNTPRSPQPRRHKQARSTGPKVPGSGRGRSTAGGRKPSPNTRGVDHTKPLERRANTPPRGARRPPPSGPARWLPAIAAAGILGVVVMAGASSGGDDGAVGTTPPPAVIDSQPDDQSVDSLTVPLTTQDVVITGSTLPAIQKNNLASPVAMGSAGGDVKKIQQRLLDLGFEPGPADGYFGELTQHAVWAYKKLVMKIPREDLAESQSASLITNDMWLSMQDPITIQPRRPLGAGTTHVEIYLPEQVMLVFTDDKPTMIAHVSSGDEQTWCELVKYDTGPEGEPLEELVERDECGQSYTPGGVFRIKRFVTGIRQSPLGSMYDPVYFNYGIAVHGANNIPLRPASHGCIRVHRELGEIFPTLVAKGNRVYVWGQDGREPEVYAQGRRADQGGTVPIFNYPNPNSTTTTSSSTTSTTSTTVPKSTTTDAPATTVAPATTATPTATTSAPTAPPTTATPATTAPPPTAAPATVPPPTAAPATTTPPPTTESPLPLP